MKINPYNQSVPYQSNKPATDAKKEATSTEKTEAPAAVYEKSPQVNKGHVYDRSIIEQLKNEADAQHANLKRMVEDLLKRQGKTFNDLRFGETVKVDETTRAEAQAAIAEDGPLGIEAVSDRIVQFAKAISGGDPEKIETLRNAIHQGFKEAEKILGELPEISRQTYDRIMEKLDDWANENFE